MLTKTFLGLGFAALLTVGLSVPTNTARAADHTAALAADAGDRPRPPSPGGWEFHACFDCPREAEEERRCLERQGWCAETRSKGPRGPYEVWKKRR